MARDGRAIITTLAVIAGFAATALLAGCGGDEGDDEATVAAEPATTAPADTGPAPEPSAQDDRGDRDVADEDDPRGERRENAGDERERGGAAEPFRRLDLV